MVYVENKEAYPYISSFKKEPFKSFVLKNKNDIKSFFISNYNKLLELYHFWNANLIKKTDLNLETLYWFLLLRKYLKQDQSERNEEIYDYIINCELTVIEKDQIGFRASPKSQSTPDLWSLYFALTSLTLIGKTEEYLQSKGQNEISRKIINLINDHKTSNGFQHCLDKHCEVCNKTPDSKTFYYVMDIFLILGVEIRLYREQFRSYLSDRRRDPSVLFRLLSLKYFDLDLDVKEKEIQYFYQFQQSDGGFNFQNIEGSNLDESFWIINVLENYSWLMDYNSAVIYSFIIEKLENLLSADLALTLNSLREVAQLIIILSLIWHKFIEEIERVLFKRLEDHGFVDFEHIKRTFGLKYGIEEIIVYINLSYTINLDIVDTKIEFDKFTENLSPERKVIAREIYFQLQQNSIISLSDIFKKYKASNHYEQLKLKEDIFPLITNLVSKHFFEGEIRPKKFLFRTRYYLCLDFLFDKIISTEKEINTERLIEEKAKLKEIKNDIYNIILKLRNVVPQIKEEIESYLIIDEIDYAKERLKFIIRNALMEADFLNENIESSFNQELKYINIQATLATEISQWNKAYSLLQTRLNDLNKILQEKIQEKEDLRNFNLFLDDLDAKVLNIEDHINRELDTFKNFISQILDEGYSEEKFNLIIKEFSVILDYFSKSDAGIYKISHQITSKEKKLAKKHKKIIDEWVNFKEKFEIINKDYTDGFQFFNEINNKILTIKDDIISRILEIKEKSKEKVLQDDFQQAFELIKKESDVLLDSKTDEIKSIKVDVKKETKFKQKLYPLYKYLLEKLEKLDENILDLVAEQVKSLKDKVIEERAKSKVENFENFIVNTILEFKEKIEIFKENLDHLKYKKVQAILDESEKILIEFDEFTRKYTKNLNNLKGIVLDYNENSILLKQYESFKSTIKNEIENLKNESINRIITEQILLMSNEGNSDKIEIKKLADKLDIKCKILIPKIKDLIEISKLQGNLIEEKKELEVHTKEYYKNKELKSFIEKKIHKQIQETIGKFLALYDSCIKNKTLGINLLEIQNRISDLSHFEKDIIQLYESKVQTLQINEDRIENNILKKNLEETIRNNKLALESVRKNLNIFKELQNYINDKFHLLKIELEKIFYKLSEEVESQQTFDKLFEAVENSKLKFDNKLKDIDSTIENHLKSVISQSYETKMFEAEIREYYVKKKGNLKTIFEEKIEIVNNQIKTQKFEKFREQLIEFLSKKRIHLSQLIGTLQTRIEDLIDTEQFKRAYIKLNNREKDIENEIKVINKEIKDLIRDYNKKSTDFERRNKHVIDDFQIFIKEFDNILREKVKASEELIVKSYVEMAIKAISRELLTLSFLQNELKIKKPKLQQYLISLISSGELHGKYDPQLGIYYENPDILKDLDEKEFEMINKMNFKMHRFYSRVKIFVNQYKSIIAFLSSFTALNYYIFMLSGQNPATILISVFLIFGLSIYFLLKKRKVDKI